MTTLQETLTKNVAQLSAVVELSVQDLPGRTKTASDKLRELANDLDKAAATGDVGAFYYPQKALASLQDSWAIQGMTDELTRLEAVTKDLTIYKNLLEIAIKESK